ncbi:MULTISPECIES: universal stress protein [Arthrobacter]|uniref:Universal stress protein n=1 Tax=Arthrobacter caoxuetaonis TaxID=2886935 RepID=A0A9X1MFH2_9MICC|nr:MULTISPECIES: universal stress protein [Arthrobacter]MCC3283734.1 universal stress protein [Arthrobacter caoxuetaonis]MCC3299124.1 universal stress protein [Arthrobacter caoxuetaonis]MCC9193171.1 universal stress protein [Arthrobacter sp. zg-Y916]USQ58544.1 universal stress protein [Arthrobacter caoxuetaonis]
MGTSPDSPQKHPVVVGVSPGQPPHVVLQAARFAERFGTELICAHVNPGRFGTGESPDGSMDSSPIDPDFADEREVGFDSRLASDLAGILADSDVSWRTLAIPGDIAAALGHLADTVDAAMIVVGTHERSLGGSIQELFNRSVAVNLARRQLRPVLVIPARALGADTAQDRTGE